MKLLLDWVVEELKTVPITLSMIVLLSYAVINLQKDHVTIEQFSALREQMSGVEYTLQHDHLDTRIHAIETELFNINQHMVDDKAKGHEIDNLYYERVDELTRADAELKRQLNLLDQTRVPSNNH